MQFKGFFLRREGGGGGGGERERERCKHAIQELLPERGGGKREREREREREADRPTGGQADNQQCVFITSHR